MRQTDKQLGGSVLKHIDPVAAAHVGLAVAGKPWEALKGLLAEDEDEMHAEATRLTDAALVDLRRRIDAEGPKTHLEIYVPARWARRPSR